MSMNILTLDDSNKILIHLIQNNNPFYISRVGMGAETSISYVYKQYGTVNDNRLISLIRTLDNYNGIYRRYNV